MKLKIGLVVAWVVFIVAAGYLSATLHTRIEKVDGVLVQAWYVFLPGERESYSSEDTVNLVDWVGSGLEGIQAQVNGKDSPELQAAVALRATGAFQGYELKQVDSHWVLYKPAETKLYFSMRVPYRVSFFRPVKR